MPDQDDLGRLPRYRKDEKEESVLRLLNRRLRGLSGEIGFEGAAPETGPVFVCGTQRAGTTLLMQLLAGAFRFTFPDCLVARFWEEPWAGLALSRSLRDPDLPPSPEWFSSDYGVPADPFGPHEFGYFWKKWFPLERAHFFPPGDLAAVNTAGLKRSLAALEHFGGSPLLFKVVPLSFHADFLGGIFPGSLFIYLERDPFFVAQSSYFARVNRYGDPARWWSLRPPEHDMLSGRNPFEQVAGQALFGRMHIRRSLEKLAGSRVLHIRYEDLCRNPGQTLSALESFLGPVTVRKPAAMPASFPCADRILLDHGQAGSLRRGLDIFSTQTNE